LPAITKSFDIHSFCFGNIYFFIFLYFYCFAVSAELLASVGIGKSVSCIRYWSVLTSPEVLRDRLVAMYSYSLFANFGLVIGRGSTFEAPGVFSR